MSFESLLSIDRSIGSPLPFSQQGLEAAATKVSLKINGHSISTRQYGRQQVSMLDKL
jgi:hypothetical protein